MKACVIAHAFYETDTRVRRYAEALRERGDTVEVVALRREGQRRDELVRGVRVFRLQQRDRRDKGSLGHAWPLVVFFLRALVLVAMRHTTSPYDLVHVHNVPDPLVFAACIPKAAGAKVILDIHDLLPEFFAEKFGHSQSSALVRGMSALERVSVRYADHTIVANDIWLDRVTQRSGAPDKCSVILNYVDQSVFTPKAAVPQRAEFLAVFPGSLNWHQGVDLAIRAVAGIRPLHPELRFDVYGEGPERDRLIHLVEELAVGDMVRFHGYVGLDEVVRAMQNADLGVVPKRADGFGNEAFSTKILEFMAVGTPVLVADTKIDRHYFDDTVACFFRAGDSQDLAAQLQRLIEAPETRASLAAHASLLAERYSWAAHKSRYLELVDRLLSERIG